MKLCFCFNNQLWSSLFMQLLFLSYFLSICMVYIFHRSLLCPDLSLLYILLLHSSHYVQPVFSPLSNTRNILSAGFLLILLLLLLIYILLLAFWNISEFFSRNFFLRSSFHALLSRCSSGNDCCS